MALNTIESHYSTGDLMPRIESMFEDAGITVSRAADDQMAALDQFHVRGIEATKQLIELAEFKFTDHILDVGSGIGGPARALNSIIGCNVDGIDITAEFVATANALTKERGQVGKVTIQQASALAIPFPDATFDGAWMQHVNMNIEDKAGMFLEIARVLRPGGKLAMHEILAGNESQPYFPVPWATGPEASFMANEKEFRAAMEPSGLKIKTWQDHTQESIDWFKATFAHIDEFGPPKISAGAILGTIFPEMAVKALQSMEEGRIQVVMVVAEKP